MNVRRFLCVALGVVACKAETLPPEGQIVLFIDTDAFVPAAPSQAPPLVPALFDRLRVDLQRTTDGAPLAGQSREFFVDEAMFRSKKVSIGIMPPPGDDDFVARVRLFRSGRVLDGEPVASSTLDTFVKLPAVPAFAKVSAGVMLLTDDVGKSLGRAEPVAAVDLPSASRVASWPGAKRADCMLAAGPDEACVPGGAFWFGDPALRGRAREVDFVEERLVIASPFFLDKTEVTVASFRAAWPTLAAQGADAPWTWSHARTGGDERDWCTFTEEEPSAEMARLPMNCVSWETARAYCRLRGGDLPSEVQYEWTMSGRGEERGYVWGESEPECADAVWGRAGSVPVLKEFSGVCRARGTIGWMDYPGTGARDRVGEIVDLGGNVTEWALDDWLLASDAFWASPAPRRDPVGKASVAGTAHPVRGASWIDGATVTRASRRAQYEGAMPWIAAGFRCARAATANVEAAP